MGGHGTQQPNDDPTDLTDPEPDGLDEVFLPADVAPWSSSAKSIVNAIKDDELRAWLTTIRNKGASVWFIADCCHSGTLTREINDPSRKPTERKRELQPEVLIPKEVLAAARANAVKTRGGPAPELSKGIVDSPSESGQGELVAMYAAQSTEPTVERPLPDEADAKERIPYGLLSFTLNQILTRATEPFTYRELTSRVYQQYVAWGRSFPTPLIEGNGADRPIFGTRDFPARSLMSLAVASGGLRINAGSLHGLTKNSILAIYPPPGQAGGRLGHVKVKSCTALDAQVEPCEYEGQPRIDKLPAGGRAEVVHIDSAPSPLLVAVVDDRGAGSAKLLDAVKSRIELPPQVVQFVTEPRDAKWIVRASTEGILVSPASEPGAATRALTPGTAGESVFGPYPENAESPALIAKNIAKIARVQQLLALAEPAGAGRIVSGSVNVELELRRFFTKGAPGKLPLIDLSQGPIKLAAAEQIDFTIVNKGRTTADVTLIYIDENFGILSWFPKPGTTTDNRLEPGASIAFPYIDRGELDPETVGKQHMLLIATRGEGPSKNFSWLNQPSIQKARDAMTGERGTESELTKLFSASAYGAGTTRGMKAAQAADCAIRTISWEFAK